MPNLVKLVLWCLIAGAWAGAILLAVGLLLHGLMEAWKRDNPK